MAFQNGYDGITLRYQSSNCSSEVLQLFRGAGRPCGMVMPEQVRAYCTTGVGHVWPSQVKAPETIPDLRHDVTMANLTQCYNDRHGMAN